MTHSLTLLQCDVVSNGGFQSPLSEREADLVSGVRSLVGDRDELRDEGKLVSVHSTVGYHARC